MFKNIYTTAWSAGARVETAKNISFKHTQYKLRYFTIS